MNEEKKRQIIYELVCDRIEDLERMNKRSQRRIDAHIDYTVQAGIKKNDKFIENCKLVIQKREAEIGELKLLRSEI